MSRKGFGIISLILVLAVILIIGGGAWYYIHHPSTKVISSFDPLNTTYTIDGQQVALVNGKAQTESAPGSEAVTEVSGQPVYGDLNKDGRMDAALLLVQNPGGTGFFYYVVAAINTSSGTQGTDAIFLGDRTGPGTAVTIKNGQILASYGERAAGQSMADDPSVPVSDTISVNGLALKVVASVVGPGEHCGGNMTTAPTCAVGYYCAPNPNSNLPFGDVGGMCAANVTPQSNGTLQGTMTIGPICPVEQVGHPCNPTPQMYAAHPVYVYQSDRQTLVTTLIPDANGQFQTALPAGNYWIDVTHQSVGAITGVPAAVRINAGVTVKIVINIDTGIR